MSYDDIFYRLEQFRRLFEHQKHLLEPESLRTMRAMQESIKLLEPATVQFAKQMEDQIRLMQPTIEHFKLTFKPDIYPDLTLDQRFIVTSELMSGLRSWAEQMQKLNDIGDLIKTSAIPTIGYITEDFQRAVDSLEQYKIYSQTFSSQLIAYLGRFEKIEQEADQQALHEEFLQFLDLSFQKLRKSRLSFEGFLNIILTILFFLYSLHANKETEERLTEEIREGDDRILSELHSNEDHMINKLSEYEQRIIAEIEEHCKEDGDSEYYVVTEAVNLREGPSTEDKIIAVLQPNMTVELIQKSDEWMYIDSFDYINLEQRRGWVHQDYLHRLDN